ITDAALLIRVKCSALRAGLLSVEVSVAHNRLEIDSTRDGLGLRSELRLAKGGDLQGDKKATEIRRNPSDVRRYASGLCRVQLAVRNAFVAPGPLQKRECPSHALLVVLLRYQ